MPDLRAPFDRREKMNGKNLRVKTTSARIGAGKDNTGGVPKIRAKTVGSASYKNGKEIQHLKLSAARMRSMKQTDGYDNNRSACACAHDFLLRIQAHVFGCLVWVGPVSNEIVIGCLHFCICVFKDL